VGWVVSVIARRHHHHHHPPVVALEPVLQVARCDRPLLLLLLLLPLLLPLRLRCDRH